MEIIERKAVAKHPKKLRVCAYCRVSTDAEEQENSLENQMKTYEEQIKSNPGYEFAGVYFDSAISGFKKKRPGFQRMLQDARDGKIDLIITKSVSRFARNTFILLEATRELKAINVGVFFELQNISTLSAEGELLLTVLAAFAQAESESGSAGAKMVYQRKYEAGIAVQYLERSFGYQKNEEGRFIPNQDEAVWVRKIYEMAADGYTPASIRRFLNDNGVRTAGGGKWLDSTVIRLLENEIYKGDYIMHKHFVNEERKLVPNRGEVDAWYIERDHEAIVSGKLWQKAQDALAKKREYLANGSVVAELNEENYPYMNRLYCAGCGYPLYRRVYSNGNRVCWGCSGMKRYGKDFCNGVNVPDGVVREWTFDGNIYIREKDRSKGRAEFSFVRESYWKRCNKKKTRETAIPPKATLEEYPYKDNIYCAECGYHLTRVTTSHKVLWVCSGNKHHTKAFCKGVRIDDEILKRNVTPGKDVYIRERKDGNGKKYYCYTGQKQERNKEA